MPERCVWVRRDGSPCRSYAVEDGLCRAHLKTRAREEEESSANASAPSRDVRGRLAKDAADAYEQIVAAIKEAVTAETTRWGDCPNCQHRVPVSFPDVSARMKALQLWLDQGLGRPVERVETTPVIDLSGLTDEELDALLVRANALEAEGHNAVNPRTEAA
jgi:hypothetical protein